MNTADAPVYDLRENSEIITRLPLGFVINADRISGDSARVTVDDQKGWIKIKDIVIYKNKFSAVDSRLILNPKIFYRENKERHLLYYYADGFIKKVDVNSRKTLTNLQCGTITGIYSSDIDGYFLLEGLLTNEQEEIHNFQVFHYHTGKKVFIGSFRKSQATIMSIEFSPNADYIAITHSNPEENTQGVSVYHSGTGQLVSHAKNIQNIHWMNDFQLLLNNREYFWIENIVFDEEIHSLNYQEGEELLTVETAWIQKNGRIYTKLDGNFLYIMGQNKVTKVDLLSFQSWDTSLKNLIFNDTQTMNFYVENGRHYLYHLKNRKNIYHFSGVHPKIQFLEFCGDSQIFGKQDYEKIESLYLYDENGNPVYRYKAIDSIEATGEKAVIAESQIEDDLGVIFIEDPVKKRFFMIIEDWSQ